MISSLNKKWMPWNIISFELAVEDVTGGHPKLQKREYLPNGYFPVVDQGQDAISGYTNNDEMVYDGSLPVILFGDHTRIFKYVNFPFVIGADGIKVLQAKKYFEAKFLYFYFKSLHIPSRGYSRHFKFLREIKIPLPPLSEQRRIVEILDQADALRRKQAEAAAKADRILPALFIKMFGDPATNPMGWDVVKMQSLYAIPPNYGTMIPPKLNDGEWLDLRVTNIQNGQLNLDDCKYINLPIEDIERHQVANGDLLLARAIGSASHIGKCIVAYPGQEKWAFDSHLMRVRFNQNLVYPEFIQNFLTSHGGRREFLRFTRQSAIQFNINTKEFNSIVVPLPPLNLQANFLGKLNSFKYFKNQQGQSSQFFNKIFEIILHRAFSVEQTAKWREAHMKEILAEMEAQTKAITDIDENEQLSLL